MGSSRTIATVGVLALVILGVVGFHLRRRAQRNRPPKWERGRLIEMIDALSGELISMPAEYWRKNEGEGILYRNPNTGEDTVVEVIYCLTCGEKVPRRRMPQEGETVEQLQGMDEAERRWLVKARWNTVCSHCGGLTRNSAVSRSGKRNSESKGYPAGPPPE